MNDFDEYPQNDFDEEVQMNVLDQETFWVNQKGHQLYLIQMAPAYRRNVLNYLLRHASEFKANYESEFLHIPPPTEPIASAAWDDGTADLFQTDADEWIEQTPLVQALRASLQQDESLGEIEGTS